MGNAQRELVWKIGERLAEKYLTDKGYRVKERNYRTKYAEIDLVAESDGVLVFVEVRAKSNEWFGSPEDTINRKKIAKLRSNAFSYVQYRRWRGPYRLDAVCVVVNQSGGLIRIEHYEDIG